MNPSPNLNTVQLFTDLAHIQTYAPELVHELQCETHPFICLNELFVIAYGSLKIHGDHSIEIKMIHAVEKRKGYGRVFIEHLKTKTDINEIWGEALYEAIPFWQKVGASFDDDSFQDYLIAKNRPIDEDAEYIPLVPFSIKTDQKRCEPHE